LAISDHEAKLEAKARSRDYLNAAFSDVTHKVEVPCPKPSPRTLVILALGQSNGANRAGTGEALRSASSPKVLNSFGGKCYHATDPMLGADGGGASIWTLVGDLLARSEAIDFVVIENASVGSSFVRDWKTGGGANWRLAAAIDSLRSAGLTPTNVTWFQGESEAVEGTTQQIYERDFIELVRGIRSSGVTAPIHVSQTTICSRPKSDQIRSAQLNLTRLVKGVYRGPDTDQLGFAFRYDGCHFSEAGRVRVAGLWFSHLRAFRQQKVGH
jgi:hypothetical protein